MFERQVIKGLPVPLPGAIIGLITLDKRFLTTVEALMEVLGLEWAVASIWTLKHLSVVMASGVGKFVFPSAFNCKPKLKMKSTSSSVSLNFGIGMSCSKSLSLFGAGLCKVLSQSFSISKNEWSETRSSVFSFRLRELERMFKRCELTMRNKYKVSLS